MIRKASAPIHRVLLVEEEARAGRRLLEGLQGAGFDLSWVYEGRQALERAMGGPYDAVVANAVLPGLPGLDLVRKLRAAGNQVPVLLLCPQAGAEDRRRCLECGADDCFQKDSPMEELVARVRQMLERDRPDAPAERLELGDLLWEPKQRRVSRREQPIELTPKEYALLVCLMEHRNEVVPRQRLMESVWGSDAEVRGNALDVQVRRLRSKLDEPFEKKLLRTLPGFGLILGT